MAYSEFPHYLNEVPDMQEVIMLYREVRDKYEGTLQEILALSKRLDEYEKDVDNRIDGAVMNAINKYKIQVDSLINTQNAVIRQEISSFEQQVNNELKDAENGFNAFTDNVELELNNFANEIVKNHAEAMSRLNTQLYAIQDVVTTTMAAYMHDVDREIAEIKATLPFEVQPVAWLWNYVLGYQGMNALEWYNETISCAEWNNSNITCLEWYTNSKSIFNWYNNHNRILSPVSGELVSAGQAVQELALQLKVNAITAGEYDAQRLTADDVECISRTVSEYDWVGDLLYKRSTVEQEGSE